MRADFLFDEIAHVHPPGIALALTLATGIVTDAQTNWPTAKVTGAAAAPRPVQIRKPRAARRRVTSKAAVRTATQAELLRSMAELVTRQAAAIDALARRLDAAEARLELLATAGQDAPAVAEIDEAQAPFRASLAIDWAEVIGRCAPVSRSCQARTPLAD